MRNIVITIVGLVALVLSAPCSAGSSECVDLVNLDLRLEENSILAYGVVVGELEFRNTGDKPCSFGGVMSIVSHSGKLVFDLELPSGKVVELRQVGGGDARTVQWSRLGPGDWAKHPVCLMKLDGKYIFAEPGVYRLRAAYGRYTPYNHNTTTGEKTPSFGAASKWVEVVVRPVGRGRPNYLNSHHWRNVHGAFHLGEELEIIRDSLPSFREYRHEQEKLLVYQSLGQRIMRGLLIEREYNELLIVEAKQALEFARACGVGVAMWEWIIGRLEEFPSDVEGRNKFMVCNGYYF